MKKLLFVLSIALLLSSCQNSEDAYQNSLKQIWGSYFENEFNDTKAVEVLVVTNRKSQSGNFECGNDKFNTEIESQLKFGSCLVNVPKNHPVGQITLTKDERQSSHDYFKILKAKSFDEEELIDQLKNSKRTPLVFVHGFNVRLEEAVLRAAGIAYDLKYQGPVVLFTWPAGSRERFFDEARLDKIYDNNLVAARDSVSFFKKFLNDLQKNNIKINLVVHSMGHQIVLPALQQTKSSRPKAINELILNAPDFDAIEFSKIAKDIKPTSKRITIYCSYNDKALLASKTINSGLRLGACTYLEDFDTINISLVDDEALGLGHGYYAGRAILGDVFQVLLEIDASKRLFIRKSEPNSTEKYFLRP